MVPLPVLNASQAAAWDERARLEVGIPSRVLMEVAGRAVASLTAASFPGAVARGVIVAAGNGNNGGDGWVAARALEAAGARVLVAESDHERSPDCEANRELALAEGVEAFESDASWPAVGLVVDALLGTGASGAPRGVLGELAARVADHGVPVVAIDGPTGLDLTTGEAHGPVRAHLTVTFGAVRRGHLLARDWCGRVAVVDIGFPSPDPAWPTLLTDRGAAAALPSFQPAMHKGSRGRVLIIGGDEGMAGAVLHAASGAFAAGAGLVKIVAHRRTVEAAQSGMPDSLTVTSSLGPEIEDDLAAALEWADAVVLGPGLGRAAERAPFVAAVLEQCHAPVVLDADALHVGMDVLCSGSCTRVLTPHAGEFRAAFPDLEGRLGEDRFAAAESAAAAAAAAATGSGAPAVLLLKGVPTVVARADQPTRVVATGNPALATGGSGDLLAGFIGAYLARGLDAQDAAALGAYTLGRGAEIAAGQNTVRATRPADVLAALPDLWRRLAKPDPIRPPILCEIEPPAIV